MSARAGMPGRPQDNCLNCPEEHPGGRGDPLFVSLSMRRPLDSFGFPVSRGAKRRRVRARAAARSAPAAALKRPCLTALRLPSGATARRLGGSPASAKSGKWSALIAEFDSLMTHSLHPPRSAVDGLGSNAAYKMTSGWNQGGFPDLESSRSGPSSRTGSHPHHTGRGGPHLLYGPPRRRLMHNSVIGP